MKLTKLSNPRYFLQTRCFANPAAVDSPLQVAWLKKENQSRLQKKPFTFQNELFGTFGNLQLPPWDAQVSLPQASTHMEAASDDDSLVVGFLEPPMNHGMVD